MNQRTDLMTAPPPREILYGEKEHAEDLYNAIVSVAPWAKDKGGKPIKSELVLLAVRRSVAMGVDPLNGHEVQIWVDHRGTLQFQLAYTLVTEWVKQFKGEHTEPQFTLLNDEEMKTELLEKGSVAYRCTFIMRDDFDQIERLIGLGWSPEAARREFTVTGLGVATADEVKDKWFAPKGRSKGWKVQKRALTDAYRKKFGTPTRPEIIELRRVGAIPEIAPGSWVVDGKDDPDQRQRHALLEQQTQESIAKVAEMSDEECEAMLARNRSILRGDEDITDWDAAPRAAPNAPHVVRCDLRRVAGWVEGENPDFSDARRPPDDEQEPPPAALVQRVAALMTDALKDEGDKEKDVDLKRYSVLSYLWRQKSTSTLTLAEAQATAQWLEAQPMVYKAGAQATEECRLILRVHSIESGQAELPLEA